MTMGMRELVERSQCVNADVPPLSVRADGETGGTLLPVPVSEVRTTPSRDAHASVLLLF